MDREAVIVLIHEEFCGGTFEEGAVFGCMRDVHRATYARAADAILALIPPTAISGADIKPGMTILLTPGGKPFRVDGVEPFNKSDSTFTLSSGPPHSWTGQLVYADRWYCLLGSSS